MNGSSHSSPQKLHGAEPILDPSAHRGALPLFDSLEGKDRAFAKVDPAVLEKYRECLTAVGKVHETFGAWLVTRVFELKHRYLSSTEKKALGALFAHLLEQGTIVEAGYGRRPNGNVARIYRLNS
jgi:hypothetical protein